MVDAEKATKIVVGLFVGGLMAAFLMPVAIGAIAGPDTTTETQELGTAGSVELKSGLTANVTSVTSGTSATYEVTGDDGSTATTTVNVGSNDTVTVDGADVTISPTNVTSTQSTTDYEYPTTYGWGSGAGAIWGILPIMIVLAIFLYFVYVAVQRVP